MKIELKKFGDILTSRQDGSEALAAIEPLLQNMSKNEMLEVNFDDVTTFTPSWADEFITKLIDLYGSRVYFINDKNPSVVATLELLKKIRLKTPLKH